MIGRLHRLLFGPQATDSSSELTSTNEPESGEANGTDSLLFNAGPSAAGAGSTGVNQGNSSSGVAAQGTAIKGTVGEQVGGKGNVDITTVDSSDPAVTMAALQANEGVASSAFDFAGGVVSGAAGLVGGVVNTALDDLESNSSASIAAGVLDTQMNDALGEQSLQSAANAEAASTTALEAASTESQETANNALAAAQNETLAGITPGQEFGAVSAGGTSSSGSWLGSLALWATILSGFIAVVYYVRKKKAL